MGLLDDLQAEVERKDAEQRRQEATEADQASYHATQLQPVMARAMAYFAELVHKLHIVEPDIQSYYPLNPLLRQGVRLRQGDYHYHYDDKHNTRQIDVRCSCSLQEREEFEIASEEAVIRHTQLLDRYRFPHHAKQHRDKRHHVRGATFYLEGPMPAGFRIEADAAQRCVQVTLQNLEPEPIKRYRFDPAQIDDALLERLGRVLLRQESTLVQVQVDEEVRRKLRTRIERDKKAKEEDMARALAEQEAERQRQAEQAGLGTRVRQSLAGGRGLGRLFKRSGRDAD